MSFSQWRIVGGKTIQAIKQNQVFKQKLYRLALFEEHLFLSEQYFSRSFWKHYLSGLMGLFFGFYLFFADFSSCSVPYVMPTKNSVFMASVYIDHRRDDLHMGENHEKVTFLPKIKRKISKRFKKIMDVFTILAQHYVLENLLPKLGYLFIFFLILFSPY